MDSFMEERIKADFIKKWPRLNKWQKKNRITKFAKEYGEKIVLINQKFVI